jgi:hypothetical protein
VMDPSGMSMLTAPTGAAAHSTSAHTKAKAILEVFIFP